MTQRCCGATMLPASALLLLSLVQRPLLAHFRAAVYSFPRLVDVAGLLSLEMAYFSTVFKTQLSLHRSVRPTRTVAAAVFTWCSVLSPTFSKPCKGWAACIQAQVPAELGLWGQM